MRPRSRRRRCGTTSTRANSRPSPGGPAHVGPAQQAPRIVVLVVGQMKGGRAVSASGRHDRLGGVMDSSMWIVFAVVAAVVVLGLILWAALRRRGAPARQERRRAEAREHRREAEIKTAESERLEAEARLKAAQAAEKDAIADVSKAEARHEAVIAADTRQQAKALSAEAADTRAQADRLDSPDPGRPSDRTDVPSDQTDISSGSGRSDSAGADRGNRAPRPSGDVST
jgi:hypothetical protein